MGTNQHVFRIRNKYLLVFDIHTCLTQVGLVFCKGSALK